MTLLIGIAALGGCQQPGIATKHRMMCERDSQLVIIDSAAWPKFVESLAKSKSQRQNWFGKSNSDYLFLHENKEAILGKSGVVRDDFLIFPGLGRRPIARIVNFSYISNTFDTKYIVTCADWPTSRYMGEFEHAR